GKLVYHVTTATSSRYDVDGASITGDENVFPFRAAWRSPTEMVYVSDGKIRMRTLGSGGTATTISFSATLAVTTPSYARTKRHFPSRPPRRVVGINNPKLSPDGKQVVFTALGDVWLMPIGGAPVNLTHDRFLDADPNWSPDGTKIAWSTDRGGQLEDIWIH